MIAEALAAGTSREECLVLEHSYKHLSPLVERGHRLHRIILRFGKVDGVQNAASVTSIDRLVAEFFTVKAGKIQEVQAVVMNRPDAEPTGWNTRWYGPGRGGWGRMPTGQ